jgi:rRNA maturation protein Nop10
VLNFFDCKPFDAKRKDIIDLAKVSASKRKSILNNKKYLYHKTEYDTVPQMLKSNKLQRGNVPLSTSEDSNPNVIFKKYKQPAVLVLHRTKLKNLKRVEYDKPDRRQELGTLQFKNEKEWTTSGSKTKEALKGVILNEKVKRVTLPEELPGMERNPYMSYPTRFATPDEFTKKRLKYKTHNEPAI